MISVCAPQHVRIEADDRIATAHGAAFDRLEQKGIWAIPAKLQHRRDRGLQVGDKTRDDKLRLSGAIACGKL